MIKKTFDCIEMKRQVVSAAQHHIAGMSDAEKIAYYKAIGDRERAAQNVIRHRDVQQLNKKSA